MTKNNKCEIRAGMMMNMKFVIRTHDEAMTSMRKMIMMMMMCGQIMTMIMKMMNTGMYPEKKKKMMNMTMISAEEGKVREAAIRAGDLDRSGVKEPVI